MRRLFFLCFSSGFECSVRIQGTAAAFQICSTGIHLVTTITHRMSVKTIRSGLIKTGKSVMAEAGKPGRQTQHVASVLK